MTMKTFTFEDLVGDEEVFFSDYFNKKPLIRRGALHRDVHRLLSVRGLDDVIALEAVHPSYLRIAKDGKGVPHKAYTRTVTSPGAPLVEAVVADKVYELFRAGGTITWNAVNHFLPSVRGLLDSITDTLACKGEVVAFLTPARQDGYAPHHDPVDVFVVQIEGSKAWRLWDTPRIRDGSPMTFSESQLGDPAAEVTLHPGDVLYMPYNTPHAAAARDQVSLHLSITVEPRRWRDLVHETVDVLVQDAHFHDFPHLDGALAPEAALDLADRLRRLSEQLAAIDPAAEVQRLAAVGRRRNGTTRSHEFERLSAADRLDAATEVRRSELPVTFADTDGTKTGLLVNGHRIAVPDAVADVLRRLQTGGVVAAAGLFPGADESRSLRAAQGLARLGVLEAADTTRRTN
jgi:ribosomal protein L16 Arg81 hydroxylase